MSGEIALVVEFFQQLLALAHPEASIDLHACLDRAMQSLLDATSIVRVSIDLSSIGGRFQRSVSRDGVALAFETPSLRAPVYNLAELDEACLEVPIRLVGFVDAATSSPPTAIDTRCAEALAGELGLHARTLTSGV